jgi:hypothetical protein
MTDKLTNDEKLMDAAFEIMQAAIKSGDWKVDGACDPDMVLQALCARLSMLDKDKTNGI